MIVIDTMRRTDQGGKWYDGRVDMERDRYVNIFTGGYLPVYVTKQHFNSNDGDRHIHN